MAYNMMGDSGMYWGVYKALYFVVASFVFSAIFWLTHNWLSNCKKK